MENPWGWHLLIDCGAGDIDKVTNPKLIKLFAKTMVERIDMVAYGKPIVKHFAEHDAEKAGYSLVQLIETSLISAHFVDCSGDFYIDIFSCKEYDQETVIDVVKEFFHPKTLNSRFVYRGVN